MNKSIFAALSLLSVLTVSTAVVAKGNKEKVVDDDKGKGKEKDTTSPAAEISESQKSMVDRHRGQRAVKSTLIRVRTIKPTSVVASRITIGVDRNGNEYAFKEFLNADDAQQEAEGLEQAKPLVEEVNALNDGEKFFPIITRYLGSSKREQDGKIDILFEKADGKALDDIFVDIPTMSEDDVKVMFHNIGEQFGNLAYHYYEKNMTFNHPDDHGGNIFYDENNNQVTFIDYAPEGNEELKLVPISEYNKDEEPSILNCPNKVLGKMRQMIWTLMPGRVSMGNMHESIVHTLTQKVNADELATVTKEIKLFTLALKSLFEGYASALPVEKHQLMQEIYQRYIKDLQFKDKSGRPYRRGGEWLNKGLTEFFDFVNAHLSSNNMPTIDAEKYLKLDIPLAQ